MIAASCLTPAAGTRRGMTWMRRGRFAAVSAHADGIAVIGTPVDVFARHMRRNALASGFTEEPWAGARRLTGFRTKPRSRHCSSCRQL